MTNRKKACILSILSIPIAILLNYILLLLKMEFMELTPIVIVLNTLALMLFFSGDK